MTVGEFLTRATKTLQDAGIETARLEVLVLLEDALGQDRSLLLAHPEAKVKSQTEVALNKKIAQRARHLPLAYLRGKAAFYGREFLVNQHVLVPRPETEAMITMLQACRFKLPAQVVPLRIADVGTGSGCLGITAALELPESKVDLYDIDAAALAVAKHNAQNNHVNARLFQEDLLSQATIRRYDVILANLPYVPANHPINQAAGHEPKLAIFAGNDGLDVYRAFWDDIAKLKWQPGYILTESFPAQHSHLKQLAAQAGYKLTRAQEYIQQFEPTG